MLAAYRVDKLINADVIIITIITKSKDRIYLTATETFVRSTFRQLISSGRLSLLLLIDIGNFCKNRNFYGGLGVQQMLLAIFYPSEFTNLNFLQ